MQYYINLKLAYIKLINEGKEITEYSVRTAWALKL